MPRLESEKRCCLIYWIDHRNFLFLIKEPIGTGHFRFRSAFQMLYDNVPDR